MLNCQLRTHACYVTYTIFNARRKREGYCSHPVCLCVCVSVCLSVCLSVTALALTYDACATKLAYQCILRCTQKVLNWAFSLQSLLSRVSACFLFALPNGRPFWNIEVATWTLTTITSNCQCLTTAFSEFDDHYPMQRPLPREGKYSYSTLYIRCLVAIWVGVVGVRVFEREYFLIVTYWTSVGVRVFEPEYFLIVTQQDLRWSASTSCSWVSSLRVFIQRKFIRLEYLCSCTTLSQLVLSPLPTPSTRPRIRNSHTITHTPRT